MLLMQQEVWEKYKLSKPLLHRMVESKILTDYRTPGGHRRYDEDEILAALRQPEKEATANDRI